MIFSLLNDIKLGIFLFFLSKLYTKPHFSALIVFTIAYNLHYFVHVTRIDETKINGV